MPQLDKDTMKVLRKFGYLNVENVDRKPVVNDMAARCQDAARKDILSKTYFVHKIIYVEHSNPKIRTKTCGHCKADTNTLIQPLGAPEMLCDICLDAYLTEKEGVKVAAKVGLSKKEKIKVKI